MSSSSIHNQHIQRRVVRILLAITAIVVVIGVPLMVMDQERLEIAQQLGLVPGRDAEKLADGDEGAVLIVIPLGEYTGVGRERYAYQAMYIARPANDGTSLTNIESGASVDVPLQSLDFIAADSDGAHILLRGPSSGDGSTDRAIVLDTASGEAEPLAAGQQAPDLPGDWVTPIWDKVTGSCDHISPRQKYIACFNRADAASYLAGDWQVDVQLFGDFEVSKAVYRGMGFLPIVGFAHEDNWLYFQNETGIYRIEIPASLRER